MGNGPRLSIYVERHISRLMLSTWLCEARAPKSAQLLVSDAARLHITRAWADRQGQRASSHWRMVASVRHAARAGSIVPTGRALATAARFVPRPTPPYRLLVPPLS